MDRYKYLSIVLPVVYPATLIMTARLCYMLAGVQELSGDAAFSLAIFSFLFGFALGALHCAYILRGEKW